MDTAVASAVDAAFDPAGSHNRRALERSKRRRPLSYRVRVAAKQHADAHPDADHLCQKLGLPCWYDGNGLERPATPTSASSSSGPLAGRRRKQQQLDADCRRRSHLEKDLRYHHGLEAAEKNLRSSKPARGSGGAFWDDVADDDNIALARSSIPLPSDRNRLQRHPSLGREDAFCDASTYKQGRGGNVRVQRIGDDDEDAQIAELYRMGLLYDDEDASGKTAAATSDLSGVINLDNIYHDEPAYSIRPARRSRRTQRGGRGLGSALNLDLSFADLGADDDLARYLVSDSNDKATSTNDEEEGEPSGITRRVSAPLRVVYELDNNSQPSFDVDTSQPPDLIVDDSLSDYDYFTDSDVMDEDMPSQEVDDPALDHGNRETAGTAATASGTWVLLGDDSQQVRNGGG